MNKKISEFHNDIKQVEELLYDIAKHKKDIKVMGLNYILPSINYKTKLSLLDRFSENIALCLKIASYIDKTIYNEMQTFLSTTKLEDHITQLLVRIRIAENEEPLSGLALGSYILRSFILDSKVTSLFDETFINIESVLTHLTRLKTIVYLLQNEYQQKIHNDDEILKPSKINISFVLSEIDVAISNLASISHIQSFEKDRIISYLEEAKSELAQESPSWKKIIGALIICATLLSGLADAPDAINNLNNAIKHILGTSIERSGPNLLIFPEIKNSDENDDMNIHIS